MRAIFSFTLSFLILSSCSNEPKNEVDQTAAVDQTEVTEKDKTINYLFESTDEGTTEFLWLAESPEGTRTWQYSSAKNSKKVDLGVRSEGGFEVLFFLNKPNEWYWVYGSECGFKLSDETRQSSQWYEQMSPECD